jgi:hypothetical protein
MRLFLGPGGPDRSRCAYAEGDQPMSVIEVRADLHGLKHDLAQWPQGHTMFSLNNAVHSSRQLQHTATDHRLSHQPSPP